MKAHLMWTIKVWSAVWAVRHPLPEMTRVQRQTVEKATKDAAELSQAARPLLEALYQRSDVRGNLSVWCPSLSGLPSSELARSFEAELASAELVSNFMADGRGTTSHASIDTLEVDDYWPTTWEALYDLPRSEWNCSSTSYTVSGAAEVGLYGFPGFRHCLPQSFGLAANRPAYTAVNTLRVDVGNPAFGNVALIWKRSLAAGASIVSPVDTGIVEFDCNASLGAPVHSVWLDQPNCSFNDWRFGTLDAVVHLAPQALAFWNSSDQNWLAIHTCRLLSDEWGSECPVNPSKTLSYFEAVVAKSAYLTHVKFVVASFAQLFGNATYGARLRRLAVDRGWVLCWGQGGSLWSGLDYNYTYAFRPMNGRLLDPATIGRTNLAQYAQSLDVFEQHWHDAQLSNWTSEMEWQAAYADLVAALPDDLAVVPLRATDNCTGFDFDDCIGTIRANFSENASHGERTCVCYTHGNPTS